MARRAVGSLLLCGALLPATAVAAEQPAAADGFSDQVSVGYVLVPVAVRSRSGWVDDLDRDDFRLTVDGQTVAIDSFERGGEAPVRLALMQDLSGSMDLGDKLEESRLAVRCLLESARPADRFALASFAGARLQVEVPYTADQAPLLEAIAAWRPYGVTALHDAVARIPDIAVTREAPNAAAVLITDGAENASALAPEEARRIVREARIPVYVLGFAGVADPGEETSDLARYAGVLRRLATFTGGRYFPLRERAEVETACAEIAIECRSRYVLGFPAGGDGPARFHRIRVEVDRHGVSISHRLGYSGRPPS